MARKAAFLLTLFAIVVQGLPQVAIAQDGGLGTLAGTVVDARGKPVAGARVIMQSAAGDNPDAAVTNSHGRFFFPQLRHGYYDVRATFRGKSSAWKHNLEVRTGKQTEVRLRLVERIRGPR